MLSPTTNPNDIKEKKRVGENFFSLPKTEHLVAWAVISVCEAAASLSNLHEGH